IPQRAPRLHRRPRFRHADDARGRRPRAGAAGRVSGPFRVAILGGGIAGLGTAYFLQKGSREKGIALECRLFEAAPSPGGVIRTERRDGFLLDTGPDSLFKGKPEAIDLAREIDLGGELLEAGRQELPTLIYSRGKLR